jgi:hypothetical protein
MSNDLRVLFIHGLESHPEGSKVRKLRAQGLEVHSADMQMSLWQLHRSNSVARQLLRLPEVRLAGLAGLGGLVASTWRRSAVGALASLTLPTGWLALRRRRLLEKALARSFDACLDIQRRAVFAAQPDVVVGSSWGGAIAAELLLEGSWSGPTVLLAPAFQKVRELTGRRDLAEASQRLRDRSREQPVVLFHDPTDDTVPHTDSLRLTAGSKIDLRSVDGGGHRLLDLLERGELARTIRALAHAEDDRAR